MRTTICDKCQTPFGLIGKRARNSTFPGLCNECARAVQESLDRFQRYLDAELALWNGTPSELSKKLNAYAITQAVNLDQCLRSAFSVSERFLRRVLMFLVQDDHLTDNEETLFMQYCEVLKVSLDAMPLLKGQLTHYRFVRNIRSGRIPVISPSVMLPAGEYAHIEASCTYIKELTSSMRQVQGSLIVTNVRLIFASHDSPFEVSLGKIVGARVISENQFLLNLSRKQGNGTYYSHQAFYIVEVVRAIMAAHHRQVVQTQAMSRVIPQHVKSEVWARDLGRCVQCGSESYLEFDHIIPFSKGGATSTGNLQLLCRMCNLKKGAKF